MDTQDFVLKQYAFLGTSLFHLDFLPLFGYSVSVFLPKFMAGPLHLM